MRARMKWGQTGVKVAINVPCFCVSVPQQWRQTSCRPSNGSWLRSRWRSTLCWDAWRRSRSSRELIVVRERRGKRTANAEGGKLRALAGPYVMVTLRGDKSGGALCHNSRQVSTHADSVYMRGLYRCPATAGRSRRESSPWRSFRLHAIWCCACHSSSTARWGFFFGFFYSNALLTPWQSNTKEIQLRSSSRRTVP